MSDQTHTYQKATEACAQYRTDRGDVSFDSVIAVAESEEEWNYLKPLDSTRKIWLGCQRNGKTWNCQNSDLEYTAGSPTNGYWGKL